jgi:geranylgeranyl pyrophosphate synthase
LDHLSDSESNCGSHGLLVVSFNVYFVLQYHKELSVQAVEMVKESRGIAKTHELAAEHAQKAVESITRLPPNPSLVVQQCRRALIDLAHQVITRSK